MNEKPYSRFPQANDPVWLVNAFNEVGIKEIKGLAHNPRIKQYHACTGLGATDDETPWCSSFICFIFQQSGIVSTRSAASLSWLRWGKELKSPVRGCVVVFERMGSDGLPLPNQGHVSFYLGENDKNVFVLGGNQSDAVGINAFRKDRIIGYRWPSLPHNSTTNLASTTAAVGTVAASAPTVMDLVDGLSDPENKMIRAVDKAQELSTGLGIPLSSAVAIVGLAVTLAGLIYIVRERNNKIKTFGI